MPLQIRSITSGSLSSNLDIQPGDTIISINGNSIQDFLDLQFYSADEELNFRIRTVSGEKTIQVHQDWTIPLGLEPVPHKCTECINKCIFCFVDQIKPGFRETLYLKDDDYRLSFTYGNFITLTNITSRQIDNILEQKLSPLYVSVHTTDADLHQKMLRYTIKFDIYERLKTLVKNGIQLHTQIVVIPEWNDRDNLERTLSDLNKLGDNILSIGIVPVGLTNWRKHLSSLRAVTPEEAELILAAAKNIPRTYCADELFILAEKNIPHEDYYQDYPQLENGIGMLRLLLENWQFNRIDFLDFARKLHEELVLVTGVSAYPVISEIASDINREIPGKARSVQVINNTFGRTVTVAGLLTAKDISEQVELQVNEMAVMSSNLFNDDLVTLDNVSQQEMKHKFNGKLLIIDEEFLDWELI